MSAHHGKGNIAIIKPWQVAILEGKELFTTDIFRADTEHAACCDKLTIPLWKRHSCDVLTMTNQHSSGGKCAPLKHSASPGCRHAYRDRLSMEVFWSGRGGDRNGGRTPVCYGTIAPGNDRNRATISDWLAKLSWTKHVPESRRSGFAIEMKDMTTCWISFF